MANATVAELDGEFGIAGVAQISEGNGGLTAVRINTPLARGEMYLHGAHVTSWKPGEAQDVLFLSPHSLWQDGRAIRGGVPVCFPWFGDKADDPHAPAHGFVRTKEWQLESIAQSDVGITVSMFTESGDDTRKWWPADFRLVYRATFGAELTLELVMTNAGAAPLRFEEALHAYFNVGDVREAQVSGLDGVHYLDKTDGFREKTQAGEVVITSETDRVYLDTEHSLELTDAVLQRKTTVGKENSRTTVVWNPWIENARALADLAEDQWTRMLCIETSNVGDYAIDLAAGQQHSMKATVRMSGS
ncbi:MAG TPA: D-hexose-6-phosphate mutarotase [Terriglobales bacterium]|nr:D-hexose-6-phosphate mutarotase [Terriglobales bacterium]